MTDIDGLDYHEIAFAQDGSLTSDGGLSTLSPAVTDLFVLSHGWNTGVTEAQDLYRGMFGLLAGVLGDRLSTAAAVGVIWPSLLFPEDAPGAPATPSTGKELAAALAPAFPGKEATLDTLGTLLDEQPQDAQQLRTFHQLASTLVTTPGLAPEDEGPAAVTTADTAAVFGHAAAMSKTPGSGAQALGNPFAVLWNGGREVLRTLSYYEMKNRAGVVGSAGLGPLIGRLAADRPGLRVHLAGHSFGARLVSFALAGLPDSAVGAASPVKSLFLIQGAFSHFSFAKPTPCQAVPQGALSDRLDRVDGPLAATFSAADRAVGWWYPAASMLAHQNAESLDDLTYEWGGMGRDGFQQVPAGTTVPLAEQGHQYGFQTGAFYLLDANSVIRANQSPFSGAHSDIQHPEVAWAWNAAAGG